MSTRTDEERLNFCGTICMAARKLGIYIRKEDKSFNWFDPMCGWTMPCEPNEDPKRALESACEQLINAIQCTTGQQPATP